MNPTIRGRIQPDLNNKGERAAVIIICFLILVISAIGYFAPKKKHTPTNQERLEQVAGELLIEAKRLDSLNNVLMHDYLRDVGSLVAQQKETDEILKRYENIKQQKDTRMVTATIHELDSFWSVRHDY